MMAVLKTPILIWNDKNAFFIGNDAVRNGKNALFNGNDAVRNDRNALLNGLNNVAEKSIFNSQYSFQ
jgi:hypothetical protein